MKFRRGHWLMQKNIEPLYAVEVYRTRILPDAVEMLVASQHIAERGNTLSAALNVRVFSPAEGVIGVEAVHFTGARNDGPEFRLNTTAGHVSIEKTETEIILRTGNASAHIAP